MSTLGRACGVGRHKLTVEVERAHILTWLTFVAPMNRPEMLLTENTCQVQLNLACPYQTFNISMWNGPSTLPWRFFFIYGTSSVFCIKLYGTPFSSSPLNLIHPGITPYRQRGSVLRAVNGGSLVTIPSNVDRQCNYIFVSGRTKNPGNALEASP